MTSNRRRRRYQAAKPSGSCWTNALSRLRQGYGVPRDNAFHPVLITVTPTGEAPASGEVLDEQVLLSDLALVLRLGLALVLR